MVVSKGSHTLKLNRNRALLPMLFLEFMEIFRAAISENTLKQMVFCGLIGFEKARRNKYSLEYGLEYVTSTLLCWGWQKWSSSCRVFLYFTRKYIFIFGEAVNIINQYYAPSGFSAATDLICASIWAWCDGICH